MKIRLVCAAALVIAALWALPAGTAAQCPLCRSTLEQADASTARTMNLAILVLLVPPVAIFCTIFAVAYKKRSGGGDGEEEN